MKSSKTPRVSWKPPGYRSFASTSDEARLVRICECTACQRDGQHEPMCQIHDHDCLEPQMCSCPMNAWLAAVSGKPPPEWVHILHAGYALCRFPGIPRDWPPGHKWVSILEKADATCPHCLREDRGV